MFACCFCEPDFVNCWGDAPLIPITFDTTAPAISCSVGVEALFPSNHRLVDVGLSASSSKPICRCRFSAEPGPDAQFSNGVLQLRARQDNASDGRVYLANRDVDGCGNVGVGCAAVVVPRNGSAAALSSVQAQAAAAEAQCSANGSPSTPYRLVP